MFSLTMRSFSPCSLAISSRTGPTILHGPHHSAQKSTSTGTSLSRTSAVKVLSVTGVVPAAIADLPAGCERWMVDGIGVGGACWSGRLGLRLLRGARGLRGLVDLTGRLRGRNVALRVEGGGAAGAGRGDRLP